VFFCSADGKFLIIKKMLYFEDNLNIAFSVKTLPRGGTFGINFRKFRFPEPYDRRRQPCYFADLSDLEIEFIGYFYVRMRVILHLYCSGLRTGCQADSDALNSLKSLFVILVWIPFTSLSSRVFSEDLYIILTETLFFPGGTESPSNTSNN